MLRIHDSWPYYNGPCASNQTNSHTKHAHTRVAHSFSRFLSLCAHFVTGCLYIYFPQWICCVSEAKIIILLSITITTVVVFVVVILLFSPYILSGSRMFITLWHFIYFLLSVNNESEVSSEYKALSISSHELKKKQGRQRLRE